MGTGIWANFHSDWESQINKQLNREWDLETSGNGLWATTFTKKGKSLGMSLGFGQNLSWKNGIYTRIQNHLSSPVLLVTTVAGCPYLCIISFTRCIIKDT